MSTTPDRVRRLLKQSLVWDNHSCMPLRPKDSSFLPQLQRYIDLSFDVVSLNVGFGPKSMEDHLRTLAAFRNWISERPEKYLLVESVGDIERAKNDQKLAITFDMEGLAALGKGDFGMLGMLAELGVKWSLIAYNQNNSFGGGCMDSDSGLTVIGRRAIEAMEKAGMVVCCSHTGHQTVRDVFEVATKPVIFSHSNSSEIFAHQRNIPDELIKECAQLGGVIGINGIGAFLGDDDDLPLMMSRHIDHLVQMVGAAHVGLGIDFVFDQDELIEYVKTMPEVFPDGIIDSNDLRLMPPEGVVELLHHLIGLGYSDEDLAAILGGNWLRVAKECW